MATGHIAVDLGASGGRAMLAVLDGDPATVELAQAHRFDHAPLETPAGPVWDLTSLWHEALTGIRAATRLAESRGVEVRSIGCDTWGVDWALVDPAGELLGLPHAYRDPANAGAMDRVLERLPDGMATVYERTGIQQQPFNTLFQLEARRATSPAVFGVVGATLLLLPDLLHYWLTGRRGVERTNASTTAMLSAATGDWDTALVGWAGLPDAALGPLVEPGTRLGGVRPSLAAEWGIGPNVEVVVPATHDTASAVAAVPVEAATGGWAYLSSGTWSLLGVELSRPNTSIAALDAGFTNEAGVGGAVRFLRNIGGLWLVQELRRDLERHGESYEYAQLAELADEAAPLRTLVDPNHPDLAAPGDAVAKLRRLAADAGEPPPQTAGELARCCYESLALSYAETLGRIEKLSDVSIGTLYVVGGGVNNTLLNRMAADATGRTVVTGPSEATALGNALVQAMGLGLVDDLSELRAIVARSFPAERLSPADDRGHGATPLPASNASVVPTREPAQPATDEPRLHSQPLGFTTHANNRHV